MSQSLTFSTGVLLLASLLLANDGTVAVQNFEFKDPQNPEKGGRVSLTDPKGCLEGQKTFEFSKATGTEIARAANISVDCAKHEIKVLGSYSAAEVKSVSPAGDVITLTGKGCSSNSIKIGPKTVLDLNGVKIQQSDLKLASSLWFYGCGPATTIDVGALGATVKILSFDPPTKTITVPAGMGCTDDKVAIEANAPVLLKGKKSDVSAIKTGEMIRFDCGPVARVRTKLAIRDLVVTLEQSLKAPEIFRAVEGGLSYKDGSLSWGLAPWLTFSFGKCGIVAADGEGDKFQCTFKPQAKADGSKSASSEPTTVDIAATKAAADRQATLLFGAAETAIAQLGKFHLDQTRSGKAVRTYFKDDGTIRVVVKPASLEVEAAPALPSGASR